MSIKNKLKNILLKELSLVDNPANQHARVSLFKRFTNVFTPDEGPSATDILQESVDSILKADGLDPAQRLEMLDASLDQFKTHVLKAACPDDMLEGDTGDTPVPKVKKDDDEGDGSDDAGPDDIEKEENDDGTHEESSVAKHTPDAGAPTGESHSHEGTMKTDILKGASPEIQAHVAEITKAAKATEDKANAIIEKAANDERVALAKSITDGTGVKPADAEVLLKQLDKPGQDVLKSTLKRMADFAKDSPLFLEKGADTDDAPGAESELAKLATEIRKANPTMSAAQAVSKALDLKPELYEQSLATK